MSELALETLRGAYRWLDRCGEKAAGEYLRQHREALRSFVHEASNDKVEDFGPESNEADAVASFLRQIQDE